MKFLKKAVIIIIALTMILGVSACKKDGGETTTTTNAPTSTTASPTTAPAPATSDESDETDPINEVEEILVDSFTTFNSIGLNGGWANVVNSFAEGHVGKQYARFEVTPAEDNIDGTIAFADYNKAAGSFSDCFIQFKLSPEGFFVTNNGESFEKLADVAYAAGNIYMVEIEADMEAGKYNAYVTAPDSERVKIAGGYAFNAKATESDDFGKVFFVSGESDQFVVDYFKRWNWYDPTKEYWSKGENFGWQQNGAWLGDVYRGKVKIEFDMMDNQTGANLNGSVDFTSSEKEVFGFGDLACLVRVHFDHGGFDARNGAVFDKIASVPCEQNVTYHIDLEIDLDNKVYSYWVTDPNGTKTQIADAFAFRETATDVDNIAQVFVVSQHANDQLVMTNLKIYEMN